jgi:CRISPR-associated protein Cmr3
VNSVGADAVEVMERLRIMGPYLVYKGERLYPAPAALIMGEDEKARPVLARLIPNQVVRTDLGRVLLPQHARALKREQSVTGAWLNTRGMTDFLMDASVDHADLVWKHQLVVDEPHIGIEIERQQRVVKKQRLSNTVHSRLTGDVEVVARVSGPTEIPAQGNVHFGAEGRMASYRTGGTVPEVHCVSQPEQKNARGIVIVFVTEASFGEDWRDSRWTPRWAKKTTSPDGTDSWVLNLLNDITVRVESACVPPYVYEGGFDVASGQDRPVRPLLPAGSVWFCRVLEWRREGRDPQEFDLNDLIKRLHGKQLGSERELGRGEIAVGFWRT